MGRWLFHCHIVSHGALGMIGELTVLPGPDTPPEITCPADIVVGNDPGAVLGGGYISWSPPPMTAAL